MSTTETQLPLDLTGAAQGPAPEVYSPPSEPAPAPDMASVMRQVQDVFAPVLDQFQAELAQFQAEVETFIYGEIDKVRGELHDHVAESLSTALHGLADRLEQRFTAVFGRLDSHDRSLAQLGALPGNSTPE